MNCYLINAQLFGICYQFWALMWSKRSALSVISLGLISRKIGQSCQVAQNKSTTTRKKKVVIMCGDEC